MDFFGYRDSNRWELDSYLNGIFSRYQVMEVQSDKVIRGLLKPRFAGMRASIRRALGSFPGRYSFETVGEDTWLTISTDLEKRGSRKWVLHLVLFAATVFTTLLVGAMREGGDILASPAELALGLPFSSSIMLILLVHELGHYFTARRYGMDVSLPFFIPLPPPFIFGTAGALIKMRSPMFTRRVLLDVGAAGPIAGFLVSLPIVALGLMESRWATHSGDFFITGHSLLFGWMAELILGPKPPGAVLEMSSVAFAGWIGFFVTAMNLVPIGQLDGGHIGYAMFGRKHTRIAYLFFFVILGLGFFWPGWLFWAVLILILIRVQHPPVLDEDIPLDPRRRAVGVFCMVILALTFMPAPIIA